MRVDAPVERHDRRGRLAPNVVRHKHEECALLSVDGDDNLVDSRRAAQGGRGPDKRWVGGGRGVSAGFEVATSTRSARGRLSAHGTQVRQ
jgi:hypothetical protein